MLKSLLHIIVYISTILIVVGFQCEKIEIDQREELSKEGDFYIFTINQGMHDSFTAIEKFSSTNIRFYVKFDSTAKYSTVDTLNQTDINKLYGFADCGDLPHTNSARFGWSFKDDTLKIFSYCYSQGERMSEFLQKIEIDSTYKFQIIIIHNEYVFKIDDKEVGRMPRGCNSTEKKSYLYPYFGGDETAPHDINIYIDDFTNYN